MQPLRIKKAANGARLTVHPCQWLLCRSHWMMIWNGSLYVVFQWTDHASDHMQHNAHGSNFLVLCQSAECWSRDWLNTVPHQTCNSHMHGVTDRVHARSNCTNSGYLPCTCAWPVELNSRPRTDDALVGPLDNGQFMITFYVNYVQTIWLNLNDN